jgi:hypothetical protein
VTGDALNTQKKTAFIILSHGGDYLLGLKDNQPTLHHHSAKPHAALCLLKTSPPKIS